MKKQVLILLTPGLLLYSCSRRSDTDISNILPSAEICGKDTINRIDAKGLKQGHWITFEVRSSNNGLSVSHSSDSVKQNASWQSVSARNKIEEGVYKDDKKNGFWKKFNPDGTIKDSVEFK